MKDCKDMLWFCLFLGLVVVAVTLIDFIDKGHTAPKEAETCLCKCNP